MIKKKKKMKYLYTGTPIFRSTHQILYCIHTYFYTILLKLKLTHHVHRPILRLLSHIVKLCHCKVSLLSASHRNIATLFKCIQHETPRRGIYTASTIIVLRLLLRTIRVNSSCTELYRGCDHARACAGIIVDIL